jgi:mono/diheme cytochrome c family protein
MSRILIFLSSAALVLAAACSPGPDADLPAPYRNLAVPQERLASPEARNRGEALYVAHCALCHGVHADGQGVRREGFSTPPANFTDPLWQKRTSTRHIFYAIREGVRGTAMPSWSGALTEDQTWDLVAYLRSVGGEAP